MAVSGSIVGRETTVFFKQGAVWGAEATGPGAGMAIMEDGLSFSQGLDAVEESGSAFLRDYDLGARTAGLNFKQALRFDDIRGIAFALGHGAYATPVEMHSGKQDYLHVIRPAADNYGDFATVALRKGAVVQTAPSLKISGFTISGQASPQRLEIVHTGVADNLIDDSAVITASAFADLEIPGGPGGRAFFRNVEFRVNDQGAAALATGDRIANAVTAFEFGFNRSMASDYTNDSGLSIEEPVEDGYPESTMRLDLRNLDIACAGGFHADMLAKTPKKLQWSVSGGAASAATGDVSPAQLTVEAPHALVENVDFGAMTGPGRIAASVTFRLLAAETATDAPGMAFTEPFQLSVINNQSARQVG